MIVSRIQKQPKPNKIVVVAPQVLAANSAPPKARDVETTVGPYASSVKSAAVPRPCAYTQIRDRAFAIYEERGSLHGHDLQDWLRAERHVMAH
jgi:hypothetical protein